MLAMPHVAHPNPTSSQKDRLSPRPRRAVTKERPAAIPLAVICKTLAQNDPIFVDPIVSTTNTCSTTNAAANFSTLRAKKGFSRQAF